MWKMKMAWKHQRSSDLLKYLGQNQDAGSETWSPVAVLGQRISKQTATQEAIRDLKPLQQTVLPPSKYNGLTTAAICVN